MKPEKFPFQLFLATLKTALVASTLRQSSYKTRIPQKNIVAEPLKIKAVYSDVYSTTEVLLH